MQKKLLLVMLLVACVALSGCALVVKDAERDKAQVIVDVNGETVDKATMSQLITEQQNDMMNSYYQMYASFGIPFDPSYVDTSTVPQTAIDGEVRRLVLSQKLASMPELALTAEEEAEIQAHGEEEYNEILDQVKTVYLSESEKEGDELTEEAKAYALTLDRRFNLDYFVDHARQEKTAEKLRAYAVRDVVVTDDEVKTEFDARVAADKEKFEGDDVTAFGTAVNGAETVYYRPAGYRYVKQVLVGFPTENSSAISAANSAKTSAQTALDNAQAALEANTTALAAEDLTEEKKAELEAAKPALQEAVDAATADLAEKTAAADQALADAFAAIQPTVDEVMAKVAAGEDFEALIETYNTDPGMKNEPGKTNGYAICAGYTPFETAFVDAAMALEKVGDVSEPIRSDSYGYYIIRYQSDIEAGPVAYEDVQASIQEELLEDKQDETYDAAVAQWTSEADVKTYIERLSN